MQKIIHIIALFLLISPIISDDSGAQQSRPPGERVIVKIIQLEHADAEHLASILKPFLSPEGRITAYGPTNSLIIKDKASIVDMLVEIIKGPQDP